MIYTHEDTTPAIHIHRICINTKANPGFVGLECIQ